MSFGHPGFLWLLPLALLPVILHLLGRRRRQERPFSWVRLLAEAQREGRYRSRPLEWLILALRVLALALPILALAGARWGSLPEIRTIAVDVSGSMQGLQRQLTRIIPVLRERFPEAHWVYFADRLLYRFQATGLPTRYSVLQGLATPLLVITDGQASGLVRFQRPTGSWWVVLLADSTRQNMAVEAVETPAPYGLRGMPVRLRIRLRNYGPVPAQRVLTLQGATPVHQQVEVPGRSTVEVTQQVVPGPGGRVQISLSPADALPCDDRQDFVFQVIHRVSLAWIGPPSVVLQALLQPEEGHRLFDVRRFSQWPGPAVLQGFDGVLVTLRPPPKAGTPLASWLRRASARVLVFDTSGAWARFLGLSTGPMARFEVQGEALRARPVTPGATTRVLLRSTSGKVVVVEQGSVVLFGFDPDRAGTWPLTENFVRLFYEVALQPRHRGWVRNGVPAGTPVSIPLPPAARPPFVLEGPQEREILTPSQSQGGEPVLQVEPLRPGLYRVLAAEDTLARFTVACPGEESDPRPAPVTTWRQRLGNQGQVLSLSQFLQLRSDPLTPWLLLLALLALALEAVLLRR